jgi:hypothetical protein
MSLPFNKTSGYFFRIAGIITAIGALPAMVAPSGGLRLATGITYSDQSPQLFPIVGHWGIMVFGMGILLYLAGSNTQIRKSTVLFSTAEKSYMVGFALYNFIAHKPYASHYMVALIGDSLMVIGGIWYLWMSYKTKQA